MLTLRRAGKTAGKYLSLTRLRLRSAIGQSAAHFCPACQRNTVGFFRYGEVRRWGCPHCGSSSRERLVNLALDKGLLSVPEGGRILQVAPSERSLVKRFRRQADLVTGDIEPEKYRAVGAVEVNLLDFDALGEFDLVYASHVIEHIADDTRVFANLYRQLHAGGAVWLLVPLAEGPTREGRPDMSPRERETQFGQWDHVRMYGDDFPDRIAAAGFEVSTIGLADFDAPDRERCGLLEQDKIFVGYKRAADLAAPASTQRTQA